MALELDASVTANTSLNEGVLEIFGSHVKCVGDWIFSLWRGRFLGFDHLKY